MEKNTVIYDAEISTLKDEEAFLEKLSTLKGEFMIFADVYRYHNVYGEVYDDIDTLKNIDEYFYTEDTKVLVDEGGDLLIINEYDGGTSEYYVRRWKKWTPGFVKYNYAEGWGNNEVDFKDWDRHTERLGKEVNSLFNINSVA